MVKKSIQVLIQLMEKLFDFMASIRLAVVVILALALLSSVGTIYESLYDRVYAQKLIYHSFWMWLVMALLAVNITAVMFDRWPWKKHHSAFVLAHIGILVLLIGSVVTYVYGIDGTMVFEIGGRNRFVQLQSNELAIYTSMDGRDYRLLHQEPVNFFGRNFKRNPYKIKLKEGELEVLDYHHFAVLKNEIVKKEVVKNETLKKKDSPEKTSLNSKGSKQQTESFQFEQPALQFLLEGSRATQSSWLFKEQMKAFDNFQMGPASVTLAGSDYQRIDENEIIFKPKGDKLFYEIYKSGNDNPHKKGQWESGKIIETGWMDFKIRVLKFYPDAQIKNTYEPVNKPSNITNSVLRVRYQGEVYDVGLNAPLKVFESDRVNVISWGSQRHDIGFNMTLADFAVGRYQGTNKAKTYESKIKVNESSELHTISMNEPFKKNGLTFYQSSFQQDESGRPTHSVLSVNKDPGRFLKYFGSLLIALGIIMLFYFKKNYFNKKPA